MTEIDAYIDAQEEPARSRLRTLRRWVHEEAPGAAEGFAYQMPAFRLDGKVLVYFAAWKKHIGFYALPTAHAAFAEELAPYKPAKGSAQFPHRDPLPEALIRRILRHRVADVRGG